MLVLASGCRGDYGDCGSPLASLAKLKWLHLAANSISDISALASLSTLTWLYLTGNALNSAAYAIYIPALEGKGINLNYDK